MARSRYQDDTQSRIDRVMGIPLGDGRLFRPGRNGGGVVVSAADAANTAATQARNADFSAATGPRPMGGYEGDSVLRAQQARLDPASNPNLRPATPANPQEEFVRQQLSALNGIVPGRNYAPEALARASLPQMQGELAALKPRGELVESFLRREESQATANAGFPTYEAATRALPVGIEPDIAQNPVGRFLIKGTRAKEPEAAPAGYASFAEAEAALGGRRGQIQQNSTTGRYVIQGQVGETEEAPGEPIISADGGFYKSRPSDEWKPLPRRGGGTVDEGTMFDRILGPDAGASPAVAPANRDQEALAWARANPADPRAARIFLRLGVKE